MSHKFILPNSPRLTRRGFVQAASSLALFSLSQTAMAGAGWITGKPKFVDYPFKLGIASGDPTPTGFVLWTRLAPVPHDPEAMGMDPVPVGYEIAADDKFKRIVQRGTAIAHPDNAHAVHAEIYGLEAGRPYWYRFFAGDEVSPIGRAVTVPLAGSKIDKYKMAFASCQNFEEGYFKAYRDMIDQDVDMIIHLGDYIYEGSWKAVTRRAPVNDAHALNEYRAIHAVYKQDEYLQAAHAHTSWLFTWDDHEVANDYAADQGQNFEDPKEFLKRRAAAYKAYYEHLPLRLSARPAGPDMKLYQRVIVGDLMEVNMLDTRQYRSDHPCQTPQEGGWQMIDQSCADITDPNRTMLGDQQERWLLYGMGRSKANWTVMAQGMLFAQHDYRVGDGVAIGSEYWDGYKVSRDKILDRIEKYNISNPVILGGDVHATYINDVKRDFNDPGSKTLATEFVATSISSGNSYYGRNMKTLGDNPHIKLYEGRYRGYSLCEIDHKGWTTDLRVVNDVRKREYEAKSLHKYFVESGRAGAEKM